MPESYTIQVRRDTLKRYVEDQMRVIAIDDLERQSADWGIEHVAKSSCITGEYDDYWAIFLCSSGENILLSSLSYVTPSSILWSLVIDEELYWANRWLEYSRQAEYLKLSAQSESREPS